MRITEIQGDLLGRYDELAQEYGTVFDTLDWLRLFGDAVRIYGMFDDGNRLFGGFYLHRRRYPLFKVVENPPHTPVMGLFFENRSANKANAASFTKKVVQEIADFLDNLGAHLLMISVPRGLQDMQPFIWRKFKVVPHYTYVVDLAASEESLLQNMSPERRNDLTRAARDGIVSEKITDPAIVRDLVRKSFDRQSKVSDAVFLDKVLSGFANDGNSFAFAAFREGRPIAVSFCLHDKRTAYYLLGGYDPENRHHGAGALAVWDSIRHAKRLGLQEFDFEGSMVESIEKYFRAFGGDLVPYYRVNKALLPLEIFLKFVKRELF